MNFKISIKGMEKMNGLIKLLFLILLIVVTISAQTKTTKKSIDKTVATDPITGHYTFRESNVINSLDVQLLSNNKIKFHLLALLKTGADSLHNGEVEDTVSIKDNVATYQEGNCKLVMKFIDNKVEVTEDNVDDCGFGAYVTAAGKYTKKSSKPKFTE